MHEHSDVIPYLFSAVVAGMAQALMYLNKQEKGHPFTWAEFLSSVALSGFMGFIICMAAHSYGLGYEAAGALAGLGGMMGKDGVSIIKGFLERFNR